MPSTRLPPQRVTRVQHSRGCKHAAAAVRVRCGCRPGLRELPAAAASHAAAAGSGRHQRCSKNECTHARCAGRQVRAVATAHAAHRQCCCTASRCTYIHRYTHTHQEAGERLCMCLHKRGTCHGRAGQHSRQHAKACTPDTGARAAHTARGHVQAGADAPRAARMLDQHQRLVAGSHALKHRHPATHTHTHTPHAYLCACRPTPSPSCGLHPSLLHG
jgi:hypothetical protein